MNYPEWVRSAAMPPAPFVAPPGKDPLPEFLRWYGSRGPALPLPPEDGLWFTGGLPGITLYRDGEFQVQLFIFPRRTLVPDHRHPNVDTIELHVAGDFHFVVEGRPAIPCEHLHDRRNGASRWWGRGVRVRPQQWHGLTVGPQGACFLSVQRWLNGVAPTTVGLDWEGQPVNGNHADVLSEAHEGAPHRECFGLAGGKT